MNRIGVIGYNEGNGHPFSFSSIFNGYNENNIDSCPYSTIPDYLRKNNSNDKLLQNSKVTHVWTQDFSISQNIAAFSNIPTIVKNLDDMIGQIDAIILARDDYENHFENVSKFFNKEIPIFIDKPLAINVNDAKNILSNQKFDGQIYSISALANDNKVIDAKNNLKSIGKINSIFGLMPGSWEKYSVHLFDPLIKIFGKDFTIKDYKVLKSDSLTMLNGTSIENSNISLTCLGGEKCAPFLNIVGEKGFLFIDFDDPYMAFRNTLQKFSENIHHKNILRSQKEIIHSISLIQMGL
ncbi:MAG: Gfo/Idh/MocA family oxidoreductase [Flavobacteriaceae bacterium]|nr:Gfo/Idh/MocA family oxidoreductase [Flavobacteriaceae bacterium]